MGKKEKQQQKEEELLQTLGDFTSKENWDKFFSIRGSDDSFEWYAEWPQLRDPLLCLLSTTNDEENNQMPASPPLQILVPGCGNSRLSEHLYDAGFHAITNIDFSKVVISEMLRRNVRSRPDMKWRIMDMTSMQFVDETFDAVLDKGGLDALMEPELGPELGTRYLSEVQRVLKKGGKFICLTLGESHVLGLLLPKFRYGWKMSVHALPQKPSNKPSLRTFMVTAEKDSSTMLQTIALSFELSSLGSHGNQIRGFSQALESENKVRMEFSNGSDILYSLEDLQLGAKGDLKEHSPGLRVLLTMGEPGLSRFIYRAVLLDSPLQSGQFLYDCGVFLVPKTRAHEWLFSSEEGQWIVVESSKSARLIMVFLDISHTEASMDEIQKDLSPLVKHLAPGKNENGPPIPFMAASDGIKQRKVVHQVTSALTGPVVVDDVVYEKVDDHFLHSLPSEDLIFRRLTFQRSESLVQSEALLKRELSLKSVGAKERNNTQSSSKSKKRGNRRRNDSYVSQVDDSIGDLKVDHNYLASSYHAGIISGFMLISPILETVASSGQSVKTTIIGLGAGLLPMFLHGCFPFMHLDVVELDPVVPDLARDFFGFSEDERLKIHLADGIQFVRDIAKSEVAVETSSSHGNEDVHCVADTPVSNGISLERSAVGEVSNKVDILVIDVDSSDSSSGMTCPAADFVEASFLSTVKDSLCEHGLFIVNLVARSPAMKELVISRMKAVFCYLYHLQLEEDVNVVIFALNARVDIDIQLPESSQKLEKLLKLNNPAASQCIIDGIKKIKHLK